MYPERYELSSNVFFHTILSTRTLSAPKCRPGCFYCCPKTVCASDLRGSYFKRSTRCHASLTKYLVQPTSGNAILHAMRRLRTCQIDLSNFQTLSTSRYTSGSSKSLGSSKPKWSVAIEKSVFRTSAAWRWPLWCTCTCGLLYSVPTVTNTSSGSGRKAPILSGCKWDNYLRYSF